VYSQICVKGEVYSGQVKFCRSDQIPSQWSYCFV